METERIEKLLAKVLVGANMSSLRVSGEWITLYFSACNLKNVTQIAIDTDSRVFVEDEKKTIDCDNIDENEFFQARRDILPKLYDLTGYDIDSGNIINEGSLRIIINGRAVTLCPKLIKATDITHHESWRVITNNNDGDQWLIKSEAEGVLINDKHPLLSQLAY
jgi:hypothetical protein